MKLLWVNDECIEDVARRRMEDCLKERFSSAEIEIVDRKLFLANSSLEEAIDEVRKIATAISGECFLLADCRICGESAGGWTMVERLLRKDSVSCLVRGAVCSEDLHPSLDDPKWASDKGRIWRFRGESTSPPEATCRQIARYLKTGSLFLDVAATALAALQQSVAFVASDLRLQTRASLSGMFVSGIGFAGGGGSYCPFSIAHAMEWEAFPETLDDFAKTVGVAMSSREREIYRNRFVSWKRTLCPFTSLECAVQWGDTSTSPFDASIKNGGALRLLWELGGGSSVRQYFTVEQQGTPPDWIQKHWLEVQYEELQKRLQKLSDSEIQGILDAASTELSEVAQFIRELGINSSQ